MRRALALAAVVVTGLSAAASANPLPPNPVHVDRRSDGSVCVSVSLQVPYCTPPVTSAVQKPDLPAVYVYENSAGATCVEVGTYVPYCVGPVKEPLRAASLGGPGRVAQR